MGASLGAVAATIGYFKEIRAICDRYDVLLIADEVMCGTGRTGSFFAHEQEAFLPDIVTLAKGLGGGYQPLAATIARAYVVEAFEVKSFSHGHTYVGHAAACAAGLAVLDTIDRHQLLQAVAVQGEKLKLAVTETFAEHPNVGDIRGRGLFQAIELVADRGSKMPFQNGAAIAARLRHCSMENGIMVYPSGSIDNCHILLAPPFIMEDQHIDEAMERLKLALTEVFGA